MGAMQGLGSTLEKNRFGERLGKQRMKGPKSRMWPGPQNGGVRG